MAASGCEKQPGDSKLVPPSLAFCPPWGLILSHNSLHGLWSPPRHSWVFSAFFLGNVSCQACMPSIHHATLKLLLCWGIVPAHCVCHELPATNISSADKLGQRLCWVVLSILVWNWLFHLKSQVPVSICFTAFPPLWPGKEWDTESLVKDF